MRSDGPSRVSTGNEKAIPGDFTFLEWLWAQVRSREGRYRAD